MDFGSETLKMFEKAPQVGGVVVSSDEEKTLNFLKMLQAEMEKRRNLFSEYGGDYASYCKNSGKTIPNIVVLVNNYSGFAEQYEDLQELFYLISRDGVKYGIYFAVTAVSTNAVRYKTQQNFKTLMTMQLNDPSDYPIIVGKTDGLVPSKYKGRGLIAMDKVYEFQTAYCSSNDDTQEFIRTYCAELAETATAFAKPIPVLPDAVTLDYVRSYVEGLQKLPIGVSKKSLNVVTTNIKNKVVYPVFSQEVHETVAFVEEFAKLTALSTTTVIVDAEQSTDATKCGCKVIDTARFILRYFFPMSVRHIMQTTAVTSV